MTRSGVGRVGSVDSGKKHALVLFGGSDQLTAALLEAGVECIAPVDAAYGSHHDVMRFQVRRVIRKWLIDGMVGFVWFGTPRIPKGGNLSAAQYKVGVDSARFTAQLIRLCTKLGIPYIVANSRGSPIWEWPSLREAHRGWALHRASCMHVCSRGNLQKRNDFERIPLWYSWCCRTFFLPYHP